MSESVKVGAEFEIPVITGARVSYWSRKKKPRFSAVLTIKDTKKQQILMGKSIVGTKLTLTFEFYKNRGPSKEIGEGSFVIIYGPDDLESKTEFSAYGQKISYLGHYFDLGRNIMRMKIEEAKASQK